MFKKLMSKVSAIIIALSIFCGIGPPELSLSVSADEAEYNITYKLPDGIQLESDAIITAKAKQEVLTYPVTEQVWDTCNGFYYAIDGVKTNTYGNKNGVRFKMPDHDIVIELIPLYDTVDQVSVEPCVGGEVTYNVQEYWGQRHLTVDCKPDENYKLATVTVTNVYESTLFEEDKCDWLWNRLYDDVASTVPRYEYIIVHAPVTIIPKFIPTDSYDIQVTSVHGSVNISTPFAVPGEEVSMTATPDPGYQFDSYNVNGNDVAFSEYKFIMPNKDVNIATNFTPESYHRLNINCDHGVVRANHYTAPSGEKMIVQILPDSDYMLDSFYIGDTEVNGCMYEFSMPDYDVDLHATFVKKTYTITQSGAYADDNHISRPCRGVIQLSQGAANPGDEISVTVFPDNGFKLSSITVGTQHTATPPVSVTIDGNVGKFIMPKDNVAVGAVCLEDSTDESKYYDIFVREDPHGSITADHSRAKKGTLITVTYNPDPGYSVRNMGADDAFFSETYKYTHTFTMPAHDILLQAQFYKSPSSVHLIQSEGGTISAVKSGEAVIVTATPDKGYYFAGYTSLYDYPDHDYAGYTLPEEITEDTESDWYPGHDYPYENYTRVYTKATFRLKNYADLYIVGKFYKPGSPLLMDEVPINAYAFPSHGGTVRLSKVSGYTDDSLPVIVTPDDDHVLVELWANWSDGMARYTWADKSLTYYTSFYHYGNGYNKIFKATFAKKPPIYTVSTQSVNHGTIVASLSSAREGDLVTITAKPDAGYNIKSIAVNGTPIEAPYTFNMPNANATISATFTNEPAAHNINLTQSTGGTLISSHSTAIAATEVTITATPNTGYSITSVTAGDTTLTSAPFTFTMPDSDVDVSAIFTQNDYNINLTQSEGGTLSSSVATAHYNDKVTITATPDASHTLTKLVIDDNDYTASPQEIAMPDHDINVSAEYTPTSYNIICDTCTNGSVSSSHTTATAGTTVTATATPAVGYKLDRLTIDGVDYVDNPKDFTMPSHDVHISAEFSLKNYDINITQSAGGTITSNATTAHYRDEVIITATPDTNYKLDKLTIDSNDYTTSPQTVTMPAHDIEVTAEFSSTSGGGSGTTSYNIICDTCTNGSVSTDVTSATEGTTITAIATPDAGYKLDKLIIDGIDYTSNPHSFTMPSHDVHVSAKFSSTSGDTGGTTSYVINLTQSEGGTITSSRTTATPGTEVIITATPDSEHTLTKLTIDESDHTTSPTAFTMPAHDVNVSAVFSKNTGGSTTKYNITCVQSEGGTVSSTHTTAAAGVTVTSSATPDKGYTLTKLVIDGIDYTTSPQDFTMPAHDVKISAIFSKDGSSDGNDDDNHPGGNDSTEYKVTCIQSEGGVVTSTHTVAKPGDRVTGTAIPDSGYKLISLTTDTETVTDASHTVTMPTHDIEISAVFAKDTSGSGSDNPHKPGDNPSKPGTEEYRVICIQTGGGTVSATHTIAKPGDRVTGSAIPDPGYRLISLTVDEDTVIESLHTVTMPAHDIYVSAIFSKDGSDSDNKKPDDKNPTKPDDNDKNPDKPSGGEDDPSKPGGNKDPEKPEKPSGGDDNPNGDNKDPSKPGEDNPHKPDGGTDNPSKPSGGDQNPGNDKDTETPSKPSDGDKPGTNDSHPSNPDGNDKEPSNPSGGDNESDNPKPNDKDLSNPNGNNDPKPDDKELDNEDTPSNNPKPGDKDPSKPNGDDEGPDNSDEEGKKPSDNPPKSDDNNNLSDGDEPSNDNGYHHPIPVTTSVPDITQVDTSVIPTGTYVYDELTDSWFYIDDSDVPKSAPNFDPDDPDTWYDTSITIPINDKNINTDKPDGSGNPITGVHSTIPIIGLGAFIILVASSKKHH